MQKNQQKTAQNRAAYAVRRKEENMKMKNLSDAPWCLLSFDGFSIPMRYCGSLNKNETIHEQSGMQLHF